MAMAVASGVGVGGVRAEGAVREWDPLRYWLPVLLLFLLSVADAFPWIVCLSQTLWACPFHMCYALAICWVISRGTPSPAPTTSTCLSTPEVSFAN